MENYYFEVYDNNEVLCTMANFAKDPDFKCLAFSNKDALEEFEAWADANFPQETFDVILVKPGETAWKVWENEQEHWEVLKDGEKPSCNMSFFEPENETQWVSFSYRKCGAHDSTIIEEWYEIDPVEPDCSEEEHNWVKQEPSWSPRNGTGTR